MQNIELRAESRRQERRRKSVEATTGQIRNDTTWNLEQSVINLRIWSRYEYPFVSLQVIPPFRRFVFLETSRYKAAVVNSSRITSHNFQWYQIDYLLTNLMLRSNFLPVDDQEL